MHKSTVSPSEIVYDYYDRRDSASSDEDEEMVPRYTARVDTSDEEECGAEITGPCPVIAADDSSDGNSLLGSPNHQSELDVSVPADKLEDDEKEKETKIDSNDLNKNTSPGVGKGVTVVAAKPKPLQESGDTEFELVDLQREVLNAEEAEFKQMLSDHYENPKAIENYVEDLSQRDQPGAIVKESTLKRQTEDLCKQYGGCEGPDAMYVKLISSDGHEFIVKREHALTSGTIKAMLSGPGQFAENETNEVNFREIPSHVLQKVCMFFTYKVRFTNSSTEIPEFPIAPEIALELLMAANFLDC